MNKIPQTSKGVRGLGKVTVQKKVVKIQTETGGVLDFTRESIKDGTPLPVEGKALPCSYRTSEDGSVLYGVSPANETVICQFNRFSAQKDQEPRPFLMPGGPRDYNGKHWVAPDQYMFTSLLTILSGDWKGCEAAVILPYAFIAEGNGEVAVKAGAKTLAKIDNALTLFGFDWAADTLKWKENILPDLETILQSRDTIFQARIEKGNVSDLMALPDELVEVYRAKSLKAKPTGEED